MLANMKDLLLSAQERNYAVGSFSVANMEMVIGVIRAAEELRAPVILQISEIYLAQSPLELIGPVMIAAAKRANVPVAVHFDNAKSENKITEALALGFTSVMFDGSQFALTENIAKTKTVIEMARLCGASVEAKIGYVGQSEKENEDAAFCTNPMEARMFERETGVDAMAISIGNAYGYYRSAPQLRFDILEEINHMTKTPLVLHGGTGLTGADYVHCMKAGIKKINIATATFDNVVHSVRAAYRENRIGSYYDLQEAEIQGAYKSAKRHILLFGTDNQAS